MNVAFLRRKAMEIMSRHRGPDNPIKREELMFQLSLWDGELYTMMDRDKKAADRAVRRVYATLPIASSAAGLYVPVKPEDLVVFKEYMTTNYGRERAAARVKIILAYYPNLAASTMKQQDLGT